MARFSDLPNELLREIAGHVMPKDIVNFSLTSKRIHALARQFLREHRELAPRYSAFDNVGEAELADFRFTKAEPWDLFPLNCYLGDLTDFLTDVLKNHLAARYVREIRTDGWWSEWESATPTDTKHEHSLYTEEQFSLFRQALLTHILPSKLETWMAELEAGDQDPIVGLLFILLPELNSIQIEQCDESSHRLEGVLKRLQTDCKANIKPLPNLEQIDLLGDGFPKPHDAHSPDALAFFATIPSVKSLYSQSIVSWGVPRDFSCLLPRSSNVRELGFKKCRITLEELDDLLQGLKALQSFTYVFQENLMGLQWNPAGMCRLLLKHAQQSLKVLVLRNEDPPTGSLPLGPINSLLGFKVLEKLVLSISLFLHRARFPSQTLLFQLPGSIREIHLHDVDLNDLPSLEDNVRQAAYVRSYRLPRLEKICLFVSWDLAVNAEAVEKLWGPCEDAGFKLCVLREVEV